MAHSPSSSLEYEQHEAGQSDMTESAMHQHTTTIVTHDVYSDRGTTLYSSIQQTSPGERRAFALTSTYPTPHVSTKNSTTQSSTNGSMKRVEYVHNSQTESEQEQESHFNDVTNGIGASTSAMSEPDRFGFIGGKTLPKELTPADLKELRERELKWVHMTKDRATWKVLMEKEFNKVKSRCRKGIPPSMRGRAWLLLSGAVPPVLPNETHPSHYIVQENIRYDEIMKKIADGTHDLDTTQDDIRKDINRQFPEHELFSLEGGQFGETGQGLLEKLLLAYAIHNPEVGYCQGQAPVAATLLMHMPLRDAFFVFVQICDKYLPNYYAKDLEEIQIDGQILFELLKSKSPLSYKHLKKHAVDPVMYMVEWFMCIYCRGLPWSTVLRIWDMFFCEGVKILFKVAIVIFRFSLGSRQDVKDYPGMYEIVQRLRNLPPEITDEEFLVSKVVELNLDEEHLEKAHYKVLKRREKEKQEKEKKERALRQS